LYHCYRRIVAQAIVDPRAYLQLRSVALGGAEEALARFDPQVVVCSRSSAEYPSGRRAAWAETPVEPVHAGISASTRSTRRGGAAR